MPAQQLPVPLKTLMTNGTELDYQQRKTLLQLYPVFATLGKCPTNNTGRPIPHDRVFLQLDNQIREIMRAVAFLYCTVTGEMNLPSTMSTKTLAEDIFTLLLSLSVAINNHRLSCIDTRLAPTRSDETVLVHNPDLALLTQKSKIEKQFSQGRSRHFLSRYRPYYGKGGKGKGYKGQQASYKGKAKRPSYSKGTPKGGGSASP